MDLFVYGTLRSEALMAAVAGSGPLNPNGATLSDFAVFPLADNVVPFVRPAPGGQVTGILWRGLHDAQVKRLDAYEGAFGYTLAPVRVQTEAGPCDAQCYMPPDGLQAGAGEWSLAVWEADHLAPAVLTAEEIFSYDPLPDHAKLRAMWPMIEGRAWARHRAHAAPATRRYAASKADFQIVDSRPPVGNFFRFQSVDVAHRRFDGAGSDTMRREAFIGSDAAIVLPYDPVRDRVLFVEQARIGPKMRHDPNPWMLEPIAGIVDARETPAAAATREGLEEAGLEFGTLHEAGSFYASPGASTDYFYTFVGTCDLPQTAPYLGGLVHEGEDLRLHTMSFAQAMDLADSGEITTGPAMYMLYWLLRHRDRLRGGL